MKRLKEILLVVLILFVGIKYTACDLIQLGDVPVIEEPTNQTITISEDIEQDVTWKKGNTYVIDGSIRVGSTQLITLTIEPGVTIKFTQGSQLDVGYWNDHYASVKALGTFEEPIVFTSNSPVPDKGDWNGVYFYKGALDCVFEFCDFTYGGSNEDHGIIYIEESTLSFSSCSFKYSKANGLYLFTDAAFAKFENNRIEYIDNYLIHLFPLGVHTIGTNNLFESGKTIFIEGDEDLRLSGTFIWENPGVPYTLDGCMRVGNPQGTVLQIEEGTVIKFTNGAQFDLAYWDDDYAELQVKGTAENPVIFTSNSQYPERGDWNGLFFYNGVGGSSISHAQITYAGQSEYLVALSCANSGFNTISLSDVLIAYSKSHAITVDSESSVDISSVSFENNLGEDYHVY